MNTVMYFPKTCIQIEMYKIIIYKRQSRYNMYSYYVYLSTINQLFTFQNDKNIRSNYSVYKMQTDAYLVIIRKTVL